MGRHQRSPYREVTKKDSLMVVTSGVNPLNSSGETVFGHSISPKFRQKKPLTMMNLGEKLPKQLDSAALNPFNPKQLSRSGQQS